jgi:hypothetical protein
MHWHKILANNRALFGFHVDLDTMRVYKARKPGMLIYSLAYIYLLLPVSSPMIPDSLQSAFQIVPEIRQPTKATKSPKEIQVGDNTKDNQIQPEVVRTRPRFRRFRKNTDTAKDSLTHSSLLLFLRSPLSTSTTMRKSKSPRSPLRQRKH